MELLGGAAIILVLLYFVPAGVALARAHRQAGPIIVVNVFLGWTFIGWVWAMAWSLSANAPPKPPSRPRVDQAELRELRERRRPND